MNRLHGLLGFLGLVGIIGVCWLFHGRTAPKAPEPIPPLDQPADDACWLAGPEPRKPLFTAEVAPILEKYCLACHGSKRIRGGVHLGAFPDDASAERVAAVWDSVSNALRSGKMPPPGQPRPTAAELHTLDAWLDAVAGTPDREPDHSANRVTVRRMNRTEYNNTIRDLIGLDLRPADDFPADDIGDGFDNSADVLSLPPILLEKYLTAAERVVDAAFRSEATRRRLLNPPDSVVPLSYRRIILPQRDHVRNRLILSAADLPPPDPAAEELQRAYLVLQAFADRAYRRPVTYEEVNRLLRFVQDAQTSGAGAEHGLRIALQAVLCSPQFLFRIETRERQTEPLPQPLPEAGRGARAPSPVLLPLPASGRGLGGGVALVDDFALATRLSYFLWSSTPDEELFAHAARGTLRQGNNLARQVRRMLRDPKSLALAENFAQQWLQTRGLKEFTPDINRFPDFDEALRSAMAHETVLFFDAVVREDRSMLDFLDADYTFVKDRLARHYGLPGDHGGEFRRVSLAGTQRGGVLTHASVLAVTSNPTRTSPVKRGRWILENILGAPPPPPPPVVEALKEPEQAAGATLRQRMERHRSDPSCASCHASMDPLGFGLEAFDALGAWRTRDGDQPVDPSGVLPDGRTFDGPAGLRALLREGRQPFARCLTEKMLTYALGRSLSRSDRRAVTAIARKLADHEYRFSALVLALVHSHPFQHRAGSGGNP